MLAHRRLVGNDRPILHAMSHWAFQFAAVYSQVMAKSAEEFWTLFKVSDLNLTSGLIFSWLYKKVLITSRIDGLPNRLTGW